MDRRKLLIAGAYGTGNLGDEAILVGLLRLFIEGKIYDRSQVVVFSRDQKKQVLFIGSSLDARISWTC